MNGILNENPTFRLLLGMCPTLAVSTAVFQGIGMGLATTFVLVFSNLVIALLRNIIPDKVRIPSFNRDYRHVCYNYRPDAQGVFAGAGASRWGSLFR